MTGRTGLLLLMVLFGAGLPRGASAQLISPGELSAAHADLEGIRNCTKCHELRQRGIERRLCLECHTPLAAILEEGRGYHATVSESCGSCHKEHGGREMDIVRFDSLSFAHERDAGFAFEGAHETASCRDCHTPRLVIDPAVRLFKREHGALESTFLGLGTECRSCHLLDDPHDGQFGQPVCTDCHDQAAWSPAPGFDHDEADFRLTGAHREVGCADCHPSDPGPQQTVRYSPLPFRQCTSCHVDYHDGGMGASCTDCHDTSSWTIDRTGFESGFDHSGTGFELMGAHETAPCASCHDAGSPPAFIEMQFAPGSVDREYAQPLVEDCLSCHVDRHEGAFVNGPGGPVCSSCHGEDHWLPSSYDLFRHNEETTFLLDGAHLATPCGSCHSSFDAAVPTTFAVEQPTCVGCHSTDDPHGSQFADRECSGCHVTTTFDIDPFDHDGTRFALDDTHREVPCASCHTADPEAQDPETIRYTPLDTTCRSCHGDTP